MLRWLQEVVEKIGLMVFSMKGTCDCEEKSTVAQVHVMG